MPASPPTVDILTIAAQPSGWYVDFGNGTALEVVCWGLLSDKTGVVPMVFSQSAQKILPAGTIGSHVLFHSATQDSIVTLLDNAAETGAGPVVSLGGMHSRKSSYVLADDGVVFNVTLRGSLDGDYWFDIGTLDSVGVESEVLKTIHYAQAVLNNVIGGAVTVRLAWS